MYSILLFWNYTVILRIFNQIENKVQTIYQFKDLYSRKDMKLVFSRFFSRDVMLLSFSRDFMREGLKRGSGKTRK
jgi:hypothetical protein